MKKGIENDISVIREKVEKLTEKKKRGKLKPRVLPKYLSEKEIQLMFQLAEKRNLRDLQILKMLYYFGLRNSEMCDLRWEHIDLERLTLKVVQGKGSKDRIIPIIEINPLPNEKGTIIDDLKLWKGNKNEGLFFEGNSAEGNISDRHVRRIVKGYARKCKIKEWERVRAHSVRHCYATHLKNKGVPLEIIQRLLGHSNVNTTLLYTYIGVEDLRREVMRYVWLAKMKLELPGKLKEINKIKGKIDRMAAQQELILKMQLAELGIFPKD